MFATQTRYFGSIFWGIVLGFFFLCGIASVSSQQEVYRVYVPVNENGEPTGDNYYVSEEFHKLLLANRDSGASRKNWSITGAKYLCSFTFNPRPQQVSGSTSIVFKAIYEIELETDSATIVLPHLPILPEGTKWNGQMLQSITLPQPERDSKTPPPNLLVFHVDHQEPGKHTLELSFNPIVEQVDTVKRRLVLPSIPKVADAVVELNLSPEMPVISVEESLGQTSDVPGKQTVQLGPTEKLTLTWNDNTVRPSQTAVESEQFYLLSAQMGQVGVSVLHKFRISGEKIRQLDLVTDPSLRLIGTPIDESSTDGTSLSFETIFPSEGLTRLVFREPVSGLITLRANYRIKDFSGIGVVRFPQIPSPPAKCWIGVSSVPTLEFDPLPPSTVNLDRFKQEWGTVSEARLLAAYEAASLPSFWMLSIRVKKPATLAKIRQAILIHQNRTDYFVEAALESDGSRFSHSFFVPENLRIERIDANVPISDTYSQQIPIDWRLCPPSPETQSGFRVLSILSESPFRENEKLEITIKGSLLAATDENVRNLPLIRLERAETEERQVDLFHDPSVVVREIVFPESWKDSERLPAVKSEFTGAIPCGTWSNDPTREKSSGMEASWFRLKVVPNAPTITGQQITQLSWNVNTDRFETTTVFDLTVENGELNTLRLKYDNQCELPVTVPVTKIDEVFDEGERFVLLRFSEPLSGKITLTLKATVNASSDSIVLPKIFPGEPLSIKHYVVLPTDHIGRLVQWEKNQLLSMNEAESEEIQQHLGSVLREPDADSSPPASTVLSTSENYEVLAVSGPDFSARLVPTGSLPTVQLNDVHLYLRKNGYISGVSTFDLLGNGTNHCVLILPDSYELVSITSGGVTTPGTFLAPGRWRFDLWSSQLPQKVEVVFRGQLMTPNGQNSLLDIRHSETQGESLLPMYVSENPETLPIELPFLESTNVLGTIWTLAMETPVKTRPLRFFVHQNFRAGGETPEKEKPKMVLPFSARDAVPVLIFMDLIRLSNMETMLSGVTANLNAPPADVAGWYSFWGRSWWGFQYELDSLLISQQIDQQVISSKFWKESLFLAGNKLPKSMERVLESTKKPEQLGLELTQLYEKAVPVSLQTESREFESNLNETTAFAAFRTSYSENISYLFGVSGGEVETLGVVSLPDQPTLWENEMVRWTLGVLTVSGGVILIRRLHPRRLFRQYPFFVGHFVAILLWLLLPPGFLGLALLPLLWLAMLWPGWKRTGRGLD
ncbi:MAG: hypothetical protein FWC43_03960 [Planctomycetaceae bacterium]|nr:hypothetical protein [Planctomycetaceae bacterium]